MKKHSYRLYYLLPLVIILLALAAVSACSSSTPTPTPTPSPTQSPTPTPTPTPSPSPTPTPTGGQVVTIDLVARNMAFDKSTITVPAGATVAINFDNQDSVPHNFALYTDSSADTPIFVGQVITKSTIIYKFVAPGEPGSYFFRCDVHPVTMTGTFVVE